MPKVGLPPSLPPSLPPNFSAICWTMRDASQLSDFCQVSEMCQNDVILCRFLDLVTFSDLIRKMQETPPREMSQFNSRSDYSDSGERFCAGLASQKSLKATSPMSESMGYCGIWTHHWWLKGLSDFLHTSPFTNPHRFGDCQSISGFFFARNYFQNISQRQHCIRVRNIRRSACVTVNTKSFFIVHRSRHL